MELSDVDLKLSKLTYQDIIEFYIRYYDNEVKYLPVEKNWYLKYKSKR